MTNINKDLGASIYTCVAGLYGLTSQIEKVKKRSERSLRGKINHGKVGKTYSPAEFKNIYSKLNVEIQELNERLIEDLEEVRK